MCSSKPAGYEFDKVKCCRDADYVKDCRLYSSESLSNTKRLSDFYQTLIPTRFLSTCYYAAEGFSILFLITKDVVEKPQSDTPHNKTAKHPTIESDASKLKLIVVYAIIVLSLE